MSTLTVRQLATRTDAFAPQESRPQGARPPQHAASGSFAEILERIRPSGPAPDTVAVSAHAAERLAERGIALTEADQAEMSKAMQLLEAKGAQEALLLRSDAAFIVSVPNRTVVTAMAHADLQHRAFTGIDSAMLL